MVVIRDWGGGNWGDIAKRHKLVTSRQVNSGDLRYNIVIIVNSTTL